MSETPRLRSAFPTTPRTTQKSRNFNISPTRPGPRDAPPSRVLTKAPAAEQDEGSPLIPSRILDPPTQRLYVAAIYVALNAWRAYESWRASDELDSTWLFLKWASIDGVCLFGLQALRIPWLEWAFPTTLALFLLHVVFNIFLMFRIPVCSILDFHEQP
jgi:nucleoporin POM152